MKKSTDIAEQIAALKAKYDEAQRKEAAAQEAEMIRLVRRAGCHREVIEMAKQRLGSKGGA